MRLSSSKALHKNQSIKDTLSNVSHSTKDTQLKGVLIARRSYQRRYQRHSTSKVLTLSISLIKEGSVIKQGRLHSFIQPHQSHHHDKERPATLRKVQIVKRKVPTIISSHKRMVSIIKEGPAIEISCLYTSSYNLYHPSIF